MYKKREAPGKVTGFSLAKEDITEVPFHLLAQRCHTAQAYAVAQMDVEDKRVYTEAVALAIRSASANSESGSDNFDGISEAVAEAKTVLTDAALEKVKRDAYTLVIEDFISEYGLKSKGWVVRQMLATFGRWKAVKDKDGEYYSPKLTLNAALKGNLWNLGLYRFAMHTKRGSFVPEQYKDPGRHYCALVPLILAGFKKYQDIKYTSWLYSELDKIVDYNLFEAMSSDVPEGLEASDLRAIREAGLLVKTGASAGTSKSATTTYKLYGVQDSMIGNLPWLAQVMLAQIWCAHPSNNTHYTNSKDEVWSTMVLDPDNWDTVPAPLVSDNIFKQVVKKADLKVTQLNLEEIEWDS